MASTKEYMREYMREYRKVNPEYVREQSEVSQRWSKENRKKRNAIALRYYHRRRAGLVGQTKVLGKSGSIVLEEHQK